MNKLNYKLINILLVTVIIFFLYLSLDLWINIFNVLKIVLIPILVSFLLSYIFTPLLVFLSKKGLNKVISIIIIILFIFGLMFLLFYFSLPVLWNELLNLLDIVITYINNLIYKNIGLSNLGDYIIFYIKDKILEISEFIYNNGINIISSTFKFITNFIIIVILTIYFTFNMDKMKLGIKKLFFGKKIYNTLRSINSNLYKYLKGLGLSMIFEIIIYTLLYFIIGHPNYMLLGPLAGITTIIPYFGQLFTNLLALITALSISKELFIASAIIMIVVPIIISYFIDPKIYQHQIKITPIKVIISLFVASTLFGFIGTVIAIPLYIVIKKILENHFYLKK